MIKNIIKRDGSVEEFNPGKVNSWVEWTTEGLEGRAEWSSIVLDTLKTLNGDVHSQDLQKALIKTCLLRRDWPHNVMAGKLYVAVLRKSMYNNKIPTIKELQKELVETKLMEDLKYTDEEYEALEKVIDHQKDFTYAHFQLHQIVKKYSIQDRVLKISYETPQFTFMRMAMALAADETENKLEQVYEYYKYLSDSVINAPTPNYVNLGTSHRGYASCCLYTAGDSAKSLAIGDHIAYTMTYMSAGIGSNINCRSVNDPVRNGAIEHLGKFPYYRSLAGAVKANLQSGRGGACTTYFSLFDKEAPRIIVAYNPRTPVASQIRDIHFASMSNLLFAKKVAKNEDIFYFNVFTAPDLTEKFYSGDQEGFEELYNKYEQDPNFKKEYTNARKLMLLSGKESYNVSVHYHFNVDEANRHTPFKEPIHSSNLCVGPNTPILTKEFGYKPIIDLLGKDVDVWNGEKWSPTTVVKTGEKQKLFTVLTDSGSSLDVTDYHKWYVQEQDIHGGVSNIVEKRTFELKPGDKLIKFDLSVCDHGDKELKLPYENGFFSGDGTKLIYNRSRIYLYDNKKNLLDYFNTDKSICSVRENNNRLEIEYRKGLLENKFFIPSCEYNLSSRLNWLSGLLDSDGHITNNNGSLNIQLVNTNYDFLVRLRYMLQELGIHSTIRKAMESGKRLLPNQKGGKELYYCKETHRILISNEEVLKLKDLGLKTNRLNLDVARPGNRESRKFVKIVDILDRSIIDDTYCFTEKERNMGMFAGVLTGQCLEICEHTAPYYDMKDLYSEEDHGRGEVAMCNLAAINVANELTDDEYYKAAYYSLKMIDKTIHLTHYELPHIGFTAKQRLNAGVGIIGFATYLARQGLKFDTKEGRQAAHAVAERHMYFLIKASLQLSKEKGIAPWMHKTKWPDGWLPIDTYKKSVDELADPIYNYDWESLRKEVIANKGIRNTVLVAHMPTESSSKASGVPNGIYPIRDLFLKKTDLKNVVSWCPVDSDILGEDYQLAYDIETVDLLKMYAVFQKFTDQSISADLYKDRTSKIEISDKEIINEYLTMVKYGVKSRYYQNSLTSKVKEEDIEEIKPEITNEEVLVDEYGYADDSDGKGCAGGSCTL